MKQNMQNGAKFELYADDEKPSSNLDGILKSSKHFYTKEKNVQNSSGNDSLTAKFYKHVSNEVSLIL